MKVKQGVYRLCGLLAVATLTVAMVALSARPTPASVNNITITASGVGFLAFFADFTNPTDPIFSFVQVIPIGGKAAAEPSYMMSYDVSDFNTFDDSGQGFIPASAVSFSGGSIAKGNAVIKLNVDTCTLPTTEFVTTPGTPCGTVEVTATETPGFSQTVNGTTKNTIGTMLETISGTTQNANAVGSANIVGFSFPSAEIIFINQFTGNIITFSRP